MTRETRAKRTTKTECTENRPLCSEVGDWVWATNPETGETALKEVVQLFRNETEEWVHITVNGETITCTPEHPFYSPAKGWINAIDLRAGDVLVYGSTAYPYAFTKKLKKGNRVYIEYGKKSKYIFNLDMATVD